MTDFIETQLAKAVKNGAPFVSLVRIDAAMADALLARNAMNRPLRPSRVLRYRSDMQSGRWTHSNGETIVVTEEGKMISGQHRCAAISGTDLVVNTFVAFGVAVESYRTVDQGAIKTAGDLLTMRGDPDGKTIAQIARLRLAFDSNDREAINDTARSTNSEVVEYCDAHADDLKASGSLALSLREHTKPIAAPSVFGFVHNVLHEIDAEPADRYITQVAKGEDIKEGDPAFVVRARLLNMGKTGASKKAAVMFAGWNAFRQKRALKTIRVVDRFPVLV